MIAAAANWTGTYALPASATPVAIAVQMRGGSATVSLGPGHAGATDVALGVHGTRVRFTFPGSPQDVVFDGAVRGSRLAGTVRQGTLHGTFALRRGLSRILALLGAYRSAAGAGAAVLEADGLAPFLIEFPSGATHGIGPALTVGERLGDTRGNGTIAVDATGFAWNGTHYARLALRQREVRIGADAATLTLPPGAGPFPAVAMVHGSGARTRDEFDVWTSYLALNGIGVLADDKRGVGASAGLYPGDAASDGTIDLLARDAQTEARWLARLPQVDPKRVGLFGDSQAGWISALAAAREPGVHWVVSVVGPTVTVGETDYWGQLAGQSESPPSGTRAAMLELVRQAGPSGFDPAASLRKLAIPALWLYGSDDRNVPTELCVDRLQSLKPGHDFSWVVLPTAHTPLVLPTGLLSSLPRSPGFDPGFFPALAGWLRGHGLIS
ncbi:MAG TPA: CocE/NonD family hydrolase [Gaiellaceae bacterium]|nr:CocE/NonD family hydrolase [Gaiellaceae bacterium]